MGTARFIATVAVLLHMATVCAQTPYPELTIQDVSWMEGTHHYAVTNSILSPATPERPTEIGASADVEFVSATEVRLLPGFHAGSFNSQGQFHARIDQGLGQPADLVIISPAPDGSSPYGSIEDNVVHVHKLEKVEVGLRLPQEYQEAVDSFFAHYYSASDPYEATSWNIDPVRDLNPYADDSLQMVMTLTRPDGSQTLKWGFFMREAKWGPGGATAKLEEDPTQPLSSYNIRFRFAPDVAGPWQYTISLKAPHTYTPSGAPLPNYSYTGYTLVCEPPLPDNNGYLEVNDANRRTLQFAGEPEEGDETPFFGLGVNLADARRLGGIQGYEDYIFHQRDFENMLGSMDALHDVGGNLLRMYLMRNMFAPEWVNLGVYDAFRTPQVCDQAFPTSCPNGGWTTDKTGSCQYQCWAFDQMVDHARTNNIYLQLCIDPYPPIIAYEKFLWGAHPYMMQFLEPVPPEPPYYNPLNMRRFFYTNGDSTLVNDAGGVFYYWKRKYKYIMSRWGYSVNVPIIEPFNETDQMLSYRAHNMVPPPVSCAQLEREPYWDICMENRAVWEQDTDLPRYISSWLNDISAYVRGSVDQGDPEHSPLGESKKLFLMSYTDAEPANTSNSTYFMPFRNPNVDLIDVHKGLYPELNGAANELNKVDWRNHEGVQHANAYWQAQPSSQKKPFNQGEFNHYTNFTIPSPVPGQPDVWNNDVEKIFHNYDVSFHNELWSSAFSGKFAAGTTWHWERVFWWEDALAVPPEDAANNFQWSPTQQFSNVAGDDNRLQLFGTTKWVRNKRLHHHFQPLADLLNRPSVQELGIFSGAYTPDEFFDDDDSDGINPLEAYYLRSDQSTAIGWVHNRNASVAKSFYVMSGSGNENFLGCTAPDSASITLSGFFPLHAHYITWFPTRIGATDLPQDSEFPSTLQSDANGDIEINLDGEFNGVANNYVDTLHADYAFVITPGPFVKSLTLDAVEDAPDAGWDFMLYPNPTRDLFAIVFDDESSKEMVVLDLAGRRLLQLTNITATRLQLSASRFAMGSYWVQVTSNGRMKTKKLIIH